MFSPDIVQLFEDSSRCSRFSLLRLFWLVFPPALCSSSGLSGSSEHRDLLLPFRCQRFPPPFFSWIPFYGRDVLIPGAPTRQCSSFFLLALPYGRPFSVGVAPFPRHPRCFFPRSSAAHPGRTGTRHSTGVFPPRSLRCWPHLVVCRGPGHAPLALSRGSPLSSPGFNRGRPPPKVVFGPCPPSLPSP